MKIDRDELKDKLSLTLKVSSDNFWVKTCKREHCCKSFKTHTRNQQYCTIRCRSISKDNFRLSRFRAWYKELRLAGATPAEAAKYSKTHNGRDKLLQDLQARKQLG